MEGTGAMRDRVERMTDHIEKDSVRSRVRSGLTSFLNDLEEIGSYEDDIDLRDTTKTRQDDGDGISVITVADSAAREQHRIDALKETLVFPASAVLVVPITGTTDINARGQFGYTRLIQAVVDHEIETVRELLLNPEVDREVKDTSGATALYKAMNRGYDDIVELFGHD